MRSSKRLAALTAGLIVGGLWVSGCGSDDSNFNGTVLLPTATVTTSTTTSNSNSSTSTGTSTQATTGTIVFNTTLAANRVITSQSSVPAAVTQFRFTGFDASYTAVYGPKIANKVAQVSLTGVPLTIRHLLVELLQNGIPVGAVAIDVNVTAGGTTTLDQAQYSYTVITGDDQEVISGSVSDPDGTDTTNLDPFFTGNSATPSPFVYNGQFLNLNTSDVLNGVVAAASTSATPGTSLVVQTPGTYLVSEIVEDSTNGNSSDLWAIVINQVQSGNVGNYATPNAAALGRTNSSSSTVQFLNAGDRVQLELYRADGGGPQGNASRLTRANLQLQLLTPGITNPVTTTSPTTTTTTTSTTDTLTSSTVIF